jgi:hypothetical protein
LLLPRRGYYGRDGKILSKGFIERIEFADIALRRQSRVVVFVKLGRGKVPEEVVMKSATGAGPSPKIATLPRRYEFTFDGAKVLPAPNNPPLQFPVTSYSVGK